MAPQILALISSDTQASERLDWVGAVRSYFDCVHSWYAVVHRGLFEQQIAALVSTPDSPPTQVYSPPLTDTPSDKALSVQYNEASLSSAPDQMSRDLALLIVAMYLTTRSRSSQESHKSMFDEIYKFIKRVVALAQLETSVPTMELVQTGALIALYEYGHGDCFAAYRTLGETVAGARVLGVRPGREGERTQASMKGEDALAEEQKSSLWWTLFILDQ